MPRAICAVSPISLAVALIANHVSAQDVTATYSLLGTPGLLEMPTAQSAPEHALAGTVSWTEGFTRATLTFQINKRLSASFRITNVDLFENPPQSGVDRDVERGFDLQYRFNNESKYVPAIAVGLRDFLTPGRLHSEYLVASKSFGDNLIVTAGVGWGAMGTNGGFTNPIGGGFTDRPAFDESEPEGQLGVDEWFRGDAAFFGGLEYQINDRWGVKAEYSSIAYPEVANSVAVPVTSPYNFGLTYRPGSRTQLGLSYLYGTQLGLSASFELNPNERANGSGLDRAPTPIQPRAANIAAARSWDRNALPEPALRSELSELLRSERITLKAVEFTDTTARVRYVNNQYRSEAQAAGRVARMMSQLLPASMETSILERERSGILVSAITMSRSDLERFENRVGGTAALLDRTEFGDARGNDGLKEVERETRAFSWGLGPFFRANPFNSNGSIDVNLGLRLRGVYRLRPNLVLSGAIEQDLLPPEDDIDLNDNAPDLQNVRSSGSLYGNDGVPVLQSLTMTHFSRPGTDLYGRVSIGYLERMFGGVSGELLWKPVDSRLGLGVELNQVAQRDSDLRFGFDEFDYDVTTGHVSAYYDLGNGYHTQLDVGRYLAGDWGATMSVDREFDNGWVIGGYFTQTDVSYEDFGNGSYNKGIRITIPQDFFSGSPTRGTFNSSFRTRVGDGGARLRVGGRLYNVVRGGHQADVTDTWGRFLR